MNLRDLLKAAARWSWLLILLTVVAAAAAFGAHALTQPRSAYRAEAVALVGPALTANADPDELDAAARVAETYASVASSAAVLGPVSDATGIPIRDLTDLVDVSVAADSSVIEIEALADAPELAVQIANLVLGRLVEIASQDTDDQDRAFMLEQARSVQAEITSVADDVQALQDVASRTPAQEARLDTLQLRLTELRSTYAQLLEAATRGGSTEVTVLEEATGARGTLSRPLVVILGALLGLALAISAAVIAEQLDDRLRSSGDIRRATGYRHLGDLQRIPQAVRRRGDRVAFLAAPHSHFSQDIRTLRANIDFAAPGLRVVGITSPRRGDGRTTVAVNLAVALARAGREVLLVDADAAAPAVHRYFGMRNTHGLTDLLVWPDGPVESVVQATQQPGLSIISSGMPTPSVNDAAGIRDVVRRIVESTVGVVIFDSPPLDEGPEAAEIAAGAEGTMLVLAFGRTPAADVAEARQMLGQARAVVIGTVASPAGIAGSSYRLDPGQPARADHATPVVTEDQPAP